MIQEMSPLRMTCNAVEYIFEADPAEAEPPAADRRTSD
jgi:hypothetical protein